MFAVAAVAVVLGATDAPPSAVDRAQAAAHQVLDRRYQHQLPIKALEDAGERAEGGKTPRGAPKREPRRAHDREDDGDLGGGGGLGMVVRMILYAVLAVALAMVLLWLVRDVWRGPGDVTLTGDAPPEPTIDEDVIARPLIDADELARSGRFADAIHALLLRTLAELVRATRTRVPSALTSREILARVPLVPDAREALHGLVNAVEITWFGDEVPAQADYDRCRAQFQRFADAYRGAA